MIASIARNLIANLLVSRPMLRPCRLSHDAGYTAWPFAGRRHAALEITTRAPRDVSGAYISPGAASVFGLAGRGAGLPVGVRRSFEVAIIATRTVDAEFAVAGAGFDHSAAFD